LLNSAPGVWSRCVSGAACMYLRTCTESTCTYCVVSILLCVCLCVAGARSCLAAGGVLLCASAPLRKFGMLANQSRPINIHEHTDLGRGDRGGGVSGAIGGAGGPENVANSR
jgi:hypothetical protein